MSSYDYMHGWNYTSPSSPFTYTSATAYPMTWTGTPNQGKVAVITPAKLTQNCINHFVLALDMSASMYNQAENLIKAVDALIAYWAKRSQELDQETRVTIYLFHSDVTCIVYDKDVLRLPSIREYYRPDRRTALIDATWLALDDLEKSAQLYGDHAFLFYALTDGCENQSHRRGSELKARLEKLPDNWTAAALVPDMNGVYEAKKYGFPPGNVAVWDTTTRDGVTEVGETMRAATDSYMTGRASGIVGTRTLFSTGSDALNKQSITAANLTRLDPTLYTAVPVTEVGAVVRPFVQDLGLKFVVGTCFYQLTKREKIQPQKDLIVREKATDRYFYGANLRALVGLSDTQLSCAPDANPDYELFVRSDSTNRKLMIGTKLLILNKRMTLV
jgi:hypothetical protein